MDEVMNMKKTLQTKNNSVGRKFIASILMIVLFVSVTMINVGAINQRWHFDFELSNFNLENSQWSAPYGGSLSVSREMPRNGNTSLKLSARTESWHSPALLLDEIFEQGGPGLYNITAYVFVTAINENYSRTGRSIIRGVETTSFIEHVSHNYFGVVSTATITPGEWVCIQGGVIVTSDDIHRGSFYWALDQIRALPGQDIFIDDVDIFKSSDSTNASNLTTFQINTKQFQPFYSYPNMPTFSDENSASEWYYDRMDEINSNGRYELVYTFNTTQANYLRELLANAALEEWWGEQIQGDIEATQELVNIALSAMIPEFGEVVEIIDFIKFVNEQSSKYFSDIGHFSNVFTAASSKMNENQNPVTISVYLLKKQPTSGYEYKVVRSDDRGVLSVNRMGEMSQGVFELAKMYCTRVAANVYDLEEGFPQTIPYTHMPSVNKVYIGYSYLNERLFQINNSTIY